MAMQRVMFGAVVLTATLVPSAAFSQSDVATVVSAEEIQTVVSAPGGGDREVRILDLGKFNLGVAVLRRNATRPGAPLAGINHSKLTEVYYVVSGSGTFISGGDRSEERRVGQQGSG